MFLSPVGDICMKHDIIFHFYADDSQIYMTFKPALEGDKAGMSLQARTLY